MDSHIWQTHKLWILQTSTTPSQQKYSCELYSAKYIDHDNKIVFWIICKNIIVDKVILCKVLQVFKKKIYAPHKSIS